MAPRARRDDARIVSDVLKGYAERGVFRSFSEAERRRGKTTFKMLWHYGRVFRLVVDSEAGTVAFPALLPGVPARSAMLKELKAFLHPFETDAVPAHRRIDPAKARLQIAARAGSASLALAVRNRELEYCTRRLVHLAQEVFMIFLPDGPYYEYRVEKLGLDPNVVWA
jgi:hypothetical protein